MSRFNKFFPTASAIGAGFFLSCSMTQAQTAPVSPQLAEWLVLTSPDGLHLPAQRYADFLKITPGWPLSTRITWRYEKALQQETDPVTLQKLCPLFPLTQFATLQHCAPYLSNHVQQARLLWRNRLSDAQSEQKFLSIYGNSLLKDDQWVRYQTLEKKGLKQAAGRQINRLSPALAHLAKARFAQRFALPTSDELFASQESSSPDEDLIRLRLHFLRQKNRLEDGYALWEEASLSHKIPAPSTASEILSYVRFFLNTPPKNEEQGNAQKALTLLSSLAQLPPGPQRNEALFLNGYARLALVNHPQKAERFFLELSHDISLTHRAEGLYWLGRCAETAGNNERAISFFRQAASFPTVFYGQLALARLTHSPFFDYVQRTALFKTRLKDRLSHLPKITGLPIPREDLVQATRTLVENGDRANAAIFISYLYVHTKETPALISVAALSAHLGLPKGAILSARKLAKAGIALYPAGYPIPYENLSLPDSTPSLPQALIPALIRQESSGDPNAISPSPAYGLMQLRLPTAEMVARKHHLGTVASPAALLDPQTNMSLGRLYLSGLLDRFDGTLPYALAAYNAGPGRVNPAETTTSNTENEDHLLRWIVLFPFKETRGYIQNIISDMGIYETISQ